MMLLAMVCWGSWTNTYRLARGWRLELYHFDYSVGVLLAALAAALTGGTLFGSPDWTGNLRSADAAALVWAACGGASLNIGNFLLMAGIERVGMTVAFPVSVGFALVVSTILNYLVHPLGDPVLLGAGVTLVFCAVLTNSYAYSSAHGPVQTRAGSGLAMCFAAGILFSISSPLVAKAMASARPLAPYGACVMYGTSSLAASVLLLFYLLRRPLGGVPLPLKSYLRGSAVNHGAGLAGGVIWGAGMVLSFVAAGLAGMAVSSAVGQANPLVAAVWGIFVWHEFRAAARRTHVLLALMLLLYATGLLLLALSFR